MEATRFGFDPSLPSTYKFDPTDADIVTHYLLPRVVGFPNPYAHAVIDDDPYSCPPWELMRRHGHEGSDHAFFFGPAPAERRRGTLRVNRRVPAGEGGGTWHGLAKGVEQDLVVVRGESGDAEFKLKFKKWLFSYRDDEKRATGWVMDEYQITDPPLRGGGAVLSRIRMTSKAMKERKKQQQAAAAAAESDQQLVPGPEQPGPSNYLDLDDGPIAGNFVVLDNGEGTSGGVQAEVLHQCDKNGGSMGEAAGYYDSLSTRERDSLLGETAGYYSAFLGAEEDGGSGGE